MLNITFCDDNREFLDNIVPMTREIFKALKEDVSIYLFTDANVLIKKFEEYKSYYDIVFLDIDMPIINGKEVARRLRLIDRKFKLIFITSFEQEALNTFQFDVSDFLPKTMLEERMPAVIERVINVINEDNPQIQIFRVNLMNEGVTIIKVPLKDIMYIESVNRKIYLHTKRYTYLLHGYKFMNLVDQFSCLGFVDIHRICIVNLTYVFSIGDTDLQLDDGTILPLSRRKRQNVLNKFLNIICEVTEC